MRPSRTVFKAVLVAAVVSLSACGATGVQNAHLLSQSIPPAEARITVTRDTSMLYMAAAADVSLNHASIIGRLGRGGSVVHNVAAGTNTLTATTAGSAGNYTISFDAAAGKHYQFEVSPRKGAMAAGGLFGVLGDTINASVNSNTGYFQIVPVGVSDE